MHALDPTDRALVEATQAGLRVTPQPYHEVAAQLGLSPEDVMERLRRLQAHGIVRRIAVVPNHYRLGYRANGMTVWDVDDAHVDRLGPEVGALPFVSHCYRRPRHLPDWPYNLFAMVHGRDRATTEAYMEAIRDLLGEACRGHTVLYSTRILKKTGLRLRSTTPGARPHGRGE